MERQFGKQSCEWLMFKDFWDLCQKVWVPEDTDEYWENTTKLADEFIDKHKSKFARSLVNALLKDLEERNKR